MVITLTKDHPDTLHTINMASVFNRQGEHGQDLQWYLRALNGREKTLGRGHPDTLNSINSMANVFKHPGEYGKALQCISVPSLAWR
jgi:hypothetical protein